MRLLYDQNLPFRLARRLAGLCPDSAHVRDLGLADAGDLQIWTHAAAEGFAIVTKDSDFSGLSQRLGFPPKVVWIRRGNCSTAEIESLLRDHHADLLAFEQDTAAGTLMLL